MVVLRTILAVCGMLAVLSAPGALAQSTVPDIVGHWDAIEDNGADHDGDLWNEKASPDQTGSIIIEIAKQSGHAFNGTFRWSFPGVTDPATHDGTQHTNQANEAIFGVFTGDGASFVIVEHPDTGMMFGRILDDNRLEVVMVESGEHAFASRTIFERRR